MPHHSAIRITGAPEGVPTIDDAFGLIRFPTAEGFLTVALPVEQLPMLLSLVVSLKAQPLPQAGVSQQVETLPVSRWSAVPTDQGGAVIGFESAKGGAVAFHMDREAALQLSRALAGFLA